MIELIDNGKAGQTGDPGMSLVLTMLDHAGQPNAGNWRPCPAPGEGASRGPTPSPPPGCAVERHSGQGASGEQVLKLASIARELTYNDYQNSRSARGDPAKTTCPPPGEGEGNEKDCPDKSPDRNVIIVLDRAWPYPSDDKGQNGEELSLLP